MNTLQTIYDKLQDKTELATHNVELNLITEVNKLVSDYYTTSNTAYSKTTGALSSLREALAIHKKSLDVTKQFDILLKKINETAKDLGITPDNWEIYRDLNIAIKEKNRTIENIKLIEKSISFLS